MKDLRPAIFTSSLFRSRYLTSELLLIEYGICITNLGNSVIDMASVLAWRLGILVNGFPLEFYFSQFHRRLVILPRRFLWCCITLNARNRQPIKGGPKLCRELRCLTT